MRLAVAAGAVAALLPLAAAQLSFWHLLANRGGARLRDPYEALDALSRVGYSALVDPDEEGSGSDSPLDTKQALEYVAKLGWSDVNIAAVTETFSTGITTPETCATCEYFMGVLKNNSGRFSMTVLVAFLWTVCYIQSYTTTEVCTGIVRAYKDDVGYVMRTTRSSPNEMCTLMFGRTCGNLTLPEHVWEIVVPEKSTSNRPAPEERAQSRDEPGSSFRVLQLSDTHYDPEYIEGSLAACDEPLCCRPASGEVQNDTDRAGRWGDLRNCDLPFRTLDNMLVHIGSQGRQSGGALLFFYEAEFAYWTGDLPPHDVWKITRAANFENFETTVTTIAKRLPGITVYPVVGNHEAVPPNMFPETDHSDAKVAEKSQWVYDTLAEDWKVWLPEDALATVRRAGYYVTKPREGLRLISLNTNFCYNFNFWLFVNSTDPGNQLHWLVDELLDAEGVGDKVHLIGHIPPGLPDCLDTWSAMFHRIVERFSDTVVGQFYGHTHYDEAIVYYSSADRSRPFGLAFVAPSVTTYSFLNPAYRMYDVDSESKLVTRHETYSMNVTEANQDGGEPHWRLEYSTEDLGLAQAGHEDWAALIDAMDTDQARFIQFVRYTTRLDDEDTRCDDACRERLLCRWRTDRAHDYSACPRDPTADRNNTTGSKEKHS
ncbi:sphingomyelin phosphodiesterase [Rhipicephalus sanguineus]|uniref:sphingomyelin phosphodiesterase n=1 Tax=Rhipicephalus sanguineus TaxID=34632 RepID=UPI0020C2926C|nr:sphingomyelin phosphodiesterase [Rhipicephalus sanguineus]